ncbi:MAG: homoaconitate hydratase family protein [Planctomycetes bacterium]|nr:homoaconitate hydratase family protein [Planctomycetota bacterium]
MGKTIIEKIFSKHSKDEVKPGNIIWLDLDIRSARDFGGANVVKNFQREYPGENVEDPGKTFFTFDCVAPAVTIPYANNQQICRDFAAEQSIKVFDVDSGIGTHVMIDSALSTPGSTVVGTDSHMNILGAVCAFGQGMGDQDIAFAYKTGKTWFEVPPSMKIEVSGNYEYPTTAKDVTLAVIKKMGASGCLGKAVEYVGDTIERMSLHERITLCSMATEMGAIITLVTPNEDVDSYFKEKGITYDISGLTPDNDAEYVESVKVDVDSLEPQAAAPYAPDNVKSVSELEGTEINSIFLGSCTNGRYEDFAIAAKIAEGKKIKPGVMFRANPSTRGVYSRLIKDGIFDKLFEAGVIMSHASCGGCASGQLGMTGAGEVQLSTSNRNFKGKQGDGQTYLVSPAVAMASAIEGKITLPE